MGLAFDAAGNLYAATPSRILKFDPAGERTIFATGFSRAASLAFDSKGDLYVADFGGNAVKRITADGVVHPFAIVQSPQFIAVQPNLAAPSVTTTSPGVVTITGALDLTYVTSHTQDFVTWTALQTNRLTANSTATIVDPGAEETARFYRTRLFP
jgi:sugar lactone lactonase YvrE